MKYFFVFFLFVSTIYSQNLKLTGVIRDASSGEQLPFANILIESANRGTTTDASGRYEFSLLPGNYEFLISYIGYKTERISVELKDTNIRRDISLVTTGVLLQEVSVYSTSNIESGSVSSISLQSKQIEEISSVFPDVFRSIQALPGIAVNNEFSAKFNVRGGNYDENLVLVNGTQVYEPFHIKEAGNASIGIFNIDLMKKVSLISGGFSAKYGDRLSSVLDIEYREGSRSNYNGSATLSLTNLDGFVEGPLGSKGSFILGVRKSYFEYVLSLIEVEETARPSFYDIQGVITYPISDANKLQLKFIHAADDFTLDPLKEFSGPFSYFGRINNKPVTIEESNQTYEESKAHYYSNLFDLQNTLFLSSNALLNTSLSYYEQTDDEDNLYTSDYNFEGKGIDYFFYNSNLHVIYINKLNIKTWEGKTVLDLKANPFYDIKTGVGYININYNQDYIHQRVRSIDQNIDTFPDTLSITLNESNNPFPQIINTNSYKLYGFIENVLQLSDAFIMNIGGRVDYFDFNKDLTISPRISASFKPQDDITVRAAWGYYYQSPIYRQLAYSTPSDTNTQSQKAEHFILGLEKNFLLNGNSANMLTVKAEGYYKKYSDLISSTKDSERSINYSRKNDSEGYAAGFDLYTSLRLTGYYGWISYGLLFAKEDLLSDGENAFPRYTDQRHTVSLVNDFDLGVDWSLNLRLTYGSGFAYTPYYSQYNSTLRRYEWLRGGKNSEHLPAYKRVDVRLGKEFSIFGLPTTAFLDVSNLFNFKNIYSYEYRFDRSGRPKREEIKLWPILPTLGITMKF